MKYILLIASFNAFFFTALLFQKRPGALHDRILITWLLYLGLFIAAYAFLSHELFTLYKPVSASLISLFMLHGPFLYFYIRALISGREKFPGKDLLHLIPFILFNQYIAGTAFFPGQAGRLDLENLTPGGDPPFLFILFSILTAISGPFYFLLSVKLFREHDINLFGKFSYSRGIDLKWLRILVLVFGVIWTALILVLVIHHVFGLFPMAFCTDGLFLSLSAFVILAGYFGLRQKVIFPNEEMGTGRETDVKEKYAGSRLPESESARYAERLIGYMRTSRPYLDEKLSLSQLATAMGVPGHLLSQVINDRLKSTFFEFVNRYRVEEFKERIRDPKYDTFSFLGIALECGFNSKSAFNRIFKEFTGLTPSQYKNSLEPLS